MQPIAADDPLARSADVVADNVAQLMALFPEAMTEGKIDFEVLKQLLGGAVEERAEKYGLNWHGKRRARQLALTPSTGTLRPCPQESVDWQTTQNLMIEGDNLEVLKLLQKSYAGKVKLIYIDPPYNTGKDFVYPDDFQDNIKNYQMLTGQIDSDGRKISSNTEASGRFHTDWLNMIYPRLKLARNLLRDDGVIFLTIDGGEVSNLLAIMNDVFGEENFVVCAAWHKRVSPANDAKWFSSDHDFVVLYARNKDVWRPQRLARNDAQLEYYRNPDNDPRGPWNSATYTCNKSKNERPNLYYAITNPNTGVEVWPKDTAVWKYSEDVTRSYLSENRLYWGAEGTSSSPRIKLFLSEMGGVVPRSIWTCDDFGHTQEATAELNALFEGNQVFDSPKPVKLLRRIIDIGCCKPGDLVLDFFAGSGTAGHAVFERNCDAPANIRFVLVQLPEPVSAADFKTIAEITKERLRRAAKKIRDETPELVKGGGMGDLGFRVFKLDSTNIQVWDPDREQLGQTLLDSVDHLKPDRSQDDVLYEILLKLGLDLCVPIEEREVTSPRFGPAHGHVVHSIGGGALMVCLSSRIESASIEPLAHGLAAWRDELAPAGETTVVFRDSAFADDVAKTNLTAILKQRGLPNVRSV